MGGAPAHQGQLDRELHVGETSVPQLEVVAAACRGAARAFFFHPHPHAPDRDDLIAREHLRERDVAGVRRTAGRAPRRRPPAAPAAGTWNSHVSAQRCQYRGTTPPTGRADPRGPQAEVGVDGPPRRVPDGRHHALGGAARLLKASAPSPSYTNSTSRSDERQLLGAEASSPITASGTGLGLSIARWITPSATPDSRPPSSGTRTSPPRTPPPRESARLRLVREQRMLGGRKMVQRPDQFGVGDERVGERRAGPGQPRADARRRGVRPARRQRRRRGAAFGHAAEGTSAASGFDAARAGPMTAAACRSPSRSRGPGRPPGRAARTRRRGRRTRARRAAPRSIGGPPRRSGRRPASIRGR